MPYNGKLLARARDRLSEIRAENREKQQRRIDEVYRRLPEVGELDRQMRSQMTQLVRLTISHRPDVKEQVEELGRRNRALQPRRAELLVEHGYPMDDRDEIGSCPKCRDTGIYQDGVCSCLDRLYKREVTKELGVLLRHGDERFEHFDLSYYPEEYDPVLRLSPRETMRKILAICKRYPEQFPQEAANLLLSGGTGLGKTFLSACIAREVADKGFSVCYDTASAALDAFEKQKFSRDPGEAEDAAARVREMLACDLMILDDLGTELLTAMSLSSLYTLINTRLVSGRKTIISTNCDADALRVRYTPQIVSRLEGEFMLLPFVGRDIRQLKKD